MVYSDISTAYFVAYSTWDNTTKPNNIRSLLVLVARLKDDSFDFELIPIWVKIDSWECKVFATETSYSSDSIWMYVFGWTGKELRYFSMHIDKTFHIRSNASENVLKLL